VCRSSFVASKGIDMTKAQVMFKASAIQGTFGGKSFEAHFKAISCFLE
jgi:hypothetical protein